MKGRVEHLVNRHTQGAQDQQCVNKCSTIHWFSWNLFGCSGFGMVWCVHASNLNRIPRHVNDS